MRAVLGIGNPGVNYVDTKHNAGFIILDGFAGKHGLTFRASKREYYYTGGEFNSTPFFLIKPTTYVNLSGIAAKDFIDEHSLAPSDLLVVVDDIHLELGKIRVRPKGGSGGHNGLESLIYHLETEMFPRLRFGIGGEFNEANQADYVLSKFSDNEKKLISSGINYSIELIERFIEGGTQKMLDYRSKESQTNNLSTPPKNKEEN